MSRSHRKPIFKDGYKSPSKKKSKRDANSTVRSTKEISNGGAYKKVYDSWDICDFVFDERFQDVSEMTPKEKAKRIRK